MLAFLLAASVALQDGLTATEAERYEEAITLLESAPDLASSYDGLVALAVSRGRVGRLDEAERPLADAIHLDPGRSEARIERGGLRFLQQRYAEAVDDLSAALRHHEDPYARDLLASSLLLLERPVEAIEQWNRVGEPRLVRLTLHGLQHTRDAVIRPEVRLHEGEHLPADTVRASVRALEETGLFADVQVRAAVVRQRELEMDLLLSERHGFGQPLELATATLTNLLVGRARLRYANVGGLGVSLGAFYRWEGARPRAEAVVDWTRPCGLPGQWRLSAYRERQPYDIGGAFTHDARGFDLRVRRVLGGRTTAEATARLRRRAFKGAPEVARDGTLAGGGLGLDQALWISPRHRLEAGVDAFVAGADTRYASAQIALVYRGTLSSPREGRAPRSQVVARAVWARGTGGMPLDQMYALGTAPDAAYPLRGHPLRDAGVLGASPIGRELRLVNAEWRWEAWSRPLFGAGLTLFHDIGHIPLTVSGADRVLLDLGMGLRWRVGTSSTVRIDYGRSLRGKSDALTIVLGESF